MVMAIAIKQRPGRGSGVCLYLLDFSQGCNTEVHELWAKKLTRLSDLPGTAGAAMLNPFTMNPGMRYHHGVPRH